MNDSTRVRLRRIDELLSDVNAEFRVRTSADERVAYKLNEARRYLAGVLDDHGERPSDELSATGELAPGAAVGA